jgi:hypothetical protein
MSANPARHKAIQACVAEALPSWTTQPTAAAPAVIQMIGSSMAGLLQRIIGAWTPRKRHEPAREAIAHSVRP